MSFSSLSTVIGARYSRLRSGLTSQRSTALSVYCSHPVEGLRLLQLCPRSSSFEDSKMSGRGPRRANIEKVGFGLFSQCSNAFCTMALQTRQSIKKSPALMSSPTPTTFHIASIVFLTSQVFFSFLLLFLSQPFWHTVLIQPNPRFRRDVWEPFNQ